jgi:DNA-binding XRE family transcriptional regulator
MAERSDNSVEASTLRIEQAKRLRRLRNRCGATQDEAAAAAHVTRDTWLRMENTGSRGTRIDAVSLRRFCAFYDVPGEYVLSGDFIGLERHVIEEIVLLERAELASSKESTADTPGSAPDRRSKRKNTDGTSKLADRATS